MNTINVALLFLISFTLIIWLLKTWIDKRLSKFDYDILSKVENLSNRSILDGLDMAHDSSFKELSKVLEPIKDKLQIYESKMENMINNETVERTKMKEMMKSITEVNFAFTQEAKTFSKVMRGDIRALGKFGEDKAELALLASGLNEGTDFLKQEYLTTGEGSIQPDFTIKLPQERAVFVDAKMPLDSFMKYLESEDDASGKIHSSELVKRINSHVSELSKKNYHSCTQFKSMDYVFMFIGSDRAISLALDVDPDIQRNALGKGILIVGPTTLMCSLKSIEFLWREERQVENLEEIAELGSHMYTKLVHFVQKLKEAQLALDKSNDALKTAMNHFNRGEKSIRGDAEKLNQLGRFSQQPLPELDE